MPFRPAQRASAILVLLVILAAGCSNEPAESDNQLDDVEADAATGTATQASTGFGVIDPTRMVLQVEDLPEGALPPSESFEVRDGAVASFTRDVTWPSVGVVGSSRLAYVRSAVHRYSSESDASNAFRTIAGFVASSDGPSYVEQRYQSWPIRSIEPTDLEVGDEAVAFLILEDTEQGGQADHVVILVRTGSVTSEIMVSAVSGRISLPDVIPLADVIADRVLDALPPSGAGVS